MNCLTFAGVLFLTNALTSDFAEAFIPVSFPYANIGLTVFRRFQSGFSGTFYRRISSVANAGLSGEEDAALDDVNITLHTSQYIDDNFQNDQASSATKILPTVWKDFTAPATSYFDSLRVPAALLSGSSLSTLFSLSGKTKHIHSQIEAMFLVLYHIFALTSFLLSLTVVVTSTATTSMMMLVRHNPIATSAIEMLKREYEFEFQLSRWSFFVGLFAFLGTIAIRAILEFELLVPNRRFSALLVFSSFATLFFHLLAFVNARLFCYKDLGEMTCAVFKMLLKKSRSGRSVAEVISRICFMVSIVSAVAMLFRSRVVTLQV